MTTHELTGLTEQQRTALETLQPLTEGERLDAQDRARANMRRMLGAKPDRTAFNTAGTRPGRDQYTEATVSEYPAWVTRVIGGMLIIAFAGAFMTSAFSVFSAGRDHYLETMQGAGIEWQAVIVGLAVVLLAEFLTIAAVLGARILFHSKRLWQAVMLIPIAGGVVIAVTANAVIAKPAGFWPWLVTVAPPVSVVFLSLILEQIALSDIKRRHMNERAFQTAAKEWKAANQADEQRYQEAVTAWEHDRATPEKLDGWQRAYANALKEAIAAMNDKGRGRTERAEFMASMTGQEWSAVVWRELTADEWLQAQPPALNAPGAAPAPKDLTITPVATIRPPALPVTSTNGNGNHNGNGRH